MKKPSEGRTAEEDLEDQRQKLYLLESDRKAFLHTSILAKQRNKEQIKQLQKENKELREQQKQLAIISGGGFSKDKPAEALLSKTEKELALWRRKWDKIMIQSNQLNEKRQRLCELQASGNEQVDNINSTDDPQMRTIGMLENKLDKAMIKYNEAQSIRKTYEMIVERLKDERVGYDNQLAAIEQSLKGKEHDFEELLLLSYDAKHAMEVAEAELRKFEAQVQAKRELRDNEVAEQRKAVQQRIESKNKIEERTKENHEKEIENKKKEHENARIEDLNKIIGQESIDKEKNNLLKYDKSMRRIKDATGVKDINEIIQKFVTQNDTLNNLNSQKEEFERKILELNDEKFEIK